MDLFSRICLPALLFPMVFIAVGVLMISISYPAYQDYKETIKIDAVVTRNEFDTWEESDGPESGYRVYVNYKYNDERYSNIYWSTKSSPVKIGNNVVVKIHPDNPSVIFNGNPFFMMLVGVAFSIFGLVITFYMAPFTIVEQEVEASTK